MEWYTDIGFLGGLASILGVGIGIPSLLLAKKQLQRTENAAEAAAASAKDAVDKISNVVAVASIEKICSRSRDLVHLMRARNLIASATAAFELREALARFIRTSIATQLMDSPQWEDLLKSVATVHEELERSAAIKKVDLNNHGQMLNSVTNIHSQLSMLTSVAGERAGGVNANSR